MSVVKSGYMRKHSKSMLSGGWKQVYCVLYQDSLFVVFKKQGDSTPMGKIKMFDVRKWFAYGQYTDGMPDRPKLPDGASIGQILAIPEKPSSKAKILWFLCDTEQDLHSWMDAICSVLPKPDQEHSAKSSHQPQAQPPIQQSHSATFASQPPPYPGGGIGFDGVASQPPAPYPAPGPSGYQQPYPQQAYPQQPYPQQAYPQQPYPQQAYPQQAYVPGQHPPPAQYHNPYGPPGAYPQQAYVGGYPQQPGYYPQQPGYAGYPQQPMYAQPHKSKSGGFLSSNTGKMAAGLAGGALLGYGASRMMGGGFGMFGLGRHGSWSSLSSFGSFGSCGSFGSFGSFG